MASAPSASSFGRARLYVLLRGCLLANPAPQTSDSSNETSVHPCSFLCQRSSRLIHIFQSPGTPLGLSGNSCPGFLLGCFSVSYFSVVVRMSTTVVGERRRNESFAGHSRTGTGSTKEGRSVAVH